MPAEKFCLQQWNGGSYEGRVGACGLNFCMIVFPQAFMYLRTATFIALSMGVLSLIEKGIAADAKSADPDLPQPLDLNLAEPLLRSSPFTREINLSDTLKLTGIAYVQGKPMVTLVNRVTKETYLISEEPNAAGWCLAGVNASSTVNRTEVKIMVGGESVTLHFSETQMNPIKKGYMPSRIPTPEEFTGHDDKGAYVRGSPYLNDEDRDRFRNGISKEAREKFVQIVHDHRELMFKSSHEERAAFVKQTLDAVEGKRRG